jgi:intracellular multiplication protein IcmL
MRIALIQSIIIAILAIGFIFYAAGQEKQYVYFATSEDGRLIPMVPLNHPNLSNPALLSWVSQASAEVMSFGFNDYRRRLQEASRHFTRTGWQSFTQALQSAQMIETINANKQVVTATPNGAPIIIKESIDTGRYEWLIQVPLLLNYQAGGRSRDERKEILIKVVRVPRLESPNGVGIEQWNVIQGSSQ